MVDYIVPLDTKQKKSNVTLNETGARDAKATPGNDFSSSTGHIPYLPSEHLFAFTGTKSNINATAAA